MSNDDDLCDYCGGYVDPIGNDGDAIARMFRRKMMLWCSLEHLKAWAVSAQVEQHRERIAAAIERGEAEAAAGGLTSLDEVLSEPEPEATR